MTYVELQELRNTHFLQYRSISHLQKLLLDPIYYSILIRRIYLRYCPYLASHSQRVQNQLPSMWNSHPLIQKENSEAGKKKC